LRRLAAVVLAAALAPAARAGEDSVLAALRAELARSTQSLVLQGQERPYFISYHAEESKAREAAASLGSLVSSREVGNHVLTVRVRVGTPALDNRHVLLGSLTAADASGSLPLDADAAAIRRRAWLLTDDGYKDALENLAGKKALLETKRPPDDSPDFSPADPQQGERDLGPSEGPARNVLEDRARRLSSVFRGYPGVALSMVRVTEGRQNRRFVSSEGSLLRLSKRFAALSVQAAASAPDGSIVSDSLSYEGDDWSDLPPDASIEEDIRRVAARLSASSQTAVLDGYQGPVLFEGEAAAQIVNQVLAPRLLALRRPLTSEEWMERWVAKVLDNPFISRLGQRVLPAFLTVYDDPGLPPARGFHGGYPWDEEGTVPRRTTLVKAGILETLLSSRAPVKGVPRSSGHAGMHGPLPANLVVESAAGVSDGEMRRRLLAEVRKRGLSFGLVVRRLRDPMADEVRRRLAGEGRGSGEERREREIVWAVKLYPDGREEAVRSAALVDLTADNFRDILAAGRPPAPRTLLFQSPAGETAVVSLVVPSLLFKDAAARRSTSKTSLPPKLPSPLLDQIP
jgi:hypothetical protein